MSLPPNRLSIFVIKIAKKHKINNNMQNFQDLDPDLGPFFMPDPGPGYASKIKCILTTGSEKNVLQSL